MGCMLVPTKNRLEAKKRFLTILPTVFGDFSRLHRVSCVGIDAAQAWADNDFEIYTREMYAMNLGWGCLKMSYLFMPHSMRLFVAICNRFNNARWWKHLQYLNVAVNTEAFVGHEIGSRRQFGERKVSRWKPESMHETLHGEL